MDLATLKAIREPTLAQKRALLIHRGYDPDADTSTLDRLGNLDIMTMGVFISAYKAMIDAAISHALRTDITVRSRTESEQNGG